MRFKSILAATAIAMALSTAAAEAAYLYVFDQTIGRFELITETIIPPNASAFAYTNNGIAGNMFTGPFRFLFVDNPVTFTDGSAYRVIIQFDIANPLPPAVGTYNQASNTFVPVNGGPTISGIPGTITITEYVPPATAVPEPATAALLGVSLLGFAAMTRRRR